MSDKIKVTITSWGVQDYKPGDTAEVEPNVARMLIGGGNAVEAKSSGKSSAPAS